MKDRAAPMKADESPKTGREAERLAEALRANLARRKAQKRARAASGQDGEKKG